MLKQRPLPKMTLLYGQMIRVLQSIANAAFPASPHRIRLLFKQASAYSQPHYSVTFVTDTIKVPRKMTRHCSIQLTPDTNDSLELDFTIKEAMKTLETMKKPSSEQKGKKPVQKKLSEVEVSKKELDEFMEIEKTLQREGGTREFTIDLVNDQKYSRIVKSKGSACSFAKDSARREKPDLILRHREYIGKLRSLRFSSGMIKKLIFFVWKSHFINRRN